MATRADFGKRLAKALKRFKQADVARQVGVDRSTVTRWVKGERFPETDQLVALCEKYGLSADVLLGLREPPPAPPQEKTHDLVLALSALVADMGRKLREFEEDQQRDRTQRLVGVPK